jgi:hypothetical protein
MQCAQFKPDVWKISVSSRGPICFTHCYPQIFPTMGVYLHPSLRSDQDAAFPAIPGLSCGFNGSPQRMH